MLGKILKKDLMKNKIINITLFIFIALSSFLAASGSNMVTQLVHSINTLFSKSNVPHFVQMHAGEMDEEALDAFALNNNLVETKQIAEMLYIDASNVQLGNHALERNSVMDHYFVTQNDSLDHLLNLENEIIHVAEGEIAVPIYYMQTANMEIGDSVTISNEAFAKEFTVVDFVRDAQMNPSIVHSKRFVVHHNDFHYLKGGVDDVEFLIEFELKDIDRLNEFREAYESAGMPRQGPVIDYHLFKALNALTDGIVATLIILISILLAIIALVCIRFTIHAAVEEDLTEIGVMKAIGISLADIKKIYLFKYIVLAAFASFIGYSASLFLGVWFTANIALYIGTAPKTLFLHLVPLLAVGFLFIFIVLFCLVIFRIIGKGTATETLRRGKVGEAGRSKKFISLKKSRFLSAPFYLSLADLFTRFRLYRLLLFVFFVCTFLILVPVNFLNTVQSPQFVQYMGVEQSDLRIDMQQVDSARFEELVRYVEDDQDVARSSPLITRQARIINDEGEQENMLIESGDFSIFPLEYMEGRAPVFRNEIAISYLNSSELEKTIGDSIQLIIKGEEKELVVSGIYQDVTNGGRTAKSSALPDNLPALWHEVAIDFKSGVRIEKKAEEYRAAFETAKVTDLKNYTDQTFGHTTEQLRFFTMIAIAVALLLAMLITSF